MVLKKHFTILLLIGLLGAGNSFGQQLTGRVTDNRGVSLQGVNVINTTKKMGTITTPRGAYSIGYTEGDTITFSSLGFEKFTLVMEDLPEEVGQINITLEPVTNQLDEVVVRSDQITDAQIQKIIDQNYGAITPERQLTQTERRAYTAASSAGGLVSFDYLLNLINGRIKRIKMLSNWERQDALIDELQAMLPESFFNEKLGMKSEDIYPFLLYCMESSNNGISAQEAVSLDMVAFFLARLEEFKEGRD